MIRVTAVPAPVKVVKIDKPFAFLLVDPDTRAVLFAGSLVRP
uniref:Serpin domain-containing protein n=1 Tax=Thermofilum pendens TaxID=2269 RepID=A0A7C3SPV2_THEPE